MPKEIFKIDTFLGGLNTATDKQHIQDAELASATGIETFDYGKIRLNGNFENRDYGDDQIEQTNALLDTSPGHGVFSFKSDKNLGNHNPGHFVATISNVQNAAQEGFPDRARAILTFASADGDTIESESLTNCTIHMRNGTHKGKIGKIKTNSRGSATVFISYTTISGSSFHTDGNVPSDGDKLYISPRNENTTYMLSYYVEQSLISAQNDFSGHNGVRLFAFSEYGSNYWGPRGQGTEFGYPIGYRMSEFSKPAFFYANGAVRWCDGEGDNITTTENQGVHWLGFIKTRIPYERLINDPTVERAHLTEVGFWVKGYSYLSPPSIGDTNGVRLTQGDPSNGPEGAGQFHVDIELNNADAFDGDGTWSQTATDRYEFHVSYLYKNGGESGLTNLGSVDGEHENANCSIMLKCNITDFLVDKRIVGIKVYWSKEGSNQYTGNQSKTFLLMAELDLEKGFKAANETTYSTLVGDYGGTYIFSRIYEFKDPPAFSSWESENGYFLKDSQTDTRFKTCVIANRRLYAAGVIVDNVAYEDAVIKSPVGNFDVLPLTNRTEASNLDGDRIVKLEEHADRILQFKEDKLEIINISQDIDFLEETFHKKGITNPGASCKTDFGIAWVNEFGAYIFDGNQVINILERNNEKVISDKDWKDFVYYGKTSNTNTPMKNKFPPSPIVGYLPNERRLVFINSDVLGSEVKAGYIFDIATQSWNKIAGGGTGLDKIEGANFTSNFISDSEDQLIVMNHLSSLRGATGGQVFEWKSSENKTINTLNTKDITIETKAYDFGSPGVAKKIHKVYFHYKGEDADQLYIKMYSSIDVDGATLHQFKNNSTGSVDTQPLTNSSVDTVVGFKIHGNTAKNVNRVWFQIYGTQNKDFELYDINVVYKTKSVK